jgi:SAM-dependent methyltransferase
MGMSSAAAIVSPRTSKIVTCPACVSMDWRTLRCTADSKYSVCECRNCRLIFSDPMLAADSAWYSSSWLYNLRESHTRAAGRDHAIPWNFLQALRELRDAHGGKLLDVGCAEGHFLYLAKKAGYEVTGIDFDFVSLEIARKLVGVSTLFESSIEELANRLPGAAFDVVTIFEVLEHTANPYQVLRCIHGLLEPGGKLLLSVPGSRRWPRLFHPEVDTPPHHLTLWSENALEELFDRAGFRIIRIQRSPLQADDLGFHLKLGLYGLIRKFQGSNASGREKIREPRPAAPETAPTRKRSGFMRQCAIAGLTPVCRAMALHPSAGGFTLFAHCKKK